MRAGWVGPLFAAALAVSSSMAFAADVAPEPAPTSTTAQPSSDSSSTSSRPHSRRPWVIGLIAAAFLLMGGLAGANDKPSKKGSAPEPPKS
jgi:hypothetical protein